MRRVFQHGIYAERSFPDLSGGLGNVAGDQLKAASDLGVPVVGVGLLYQQGYFRQMIEPERNAAGPFPYNDPGQLPIAPLRQANGEWLRLEIALPGILGLATCLAGPGRQELSFTCWTARAPRTFRLIGGSRANFMAAARSCV